MSTNWPKTYHNIQHHMRTRLTEADQYRLSHIAQARPLSDGRSLNLFRRILNRAGTALWPRETPQPHLNERALS